MSRHPDSESIARSFMGVDHGVDIGRRRLVTSSWLSPDLGAVARARAGPRPCSRFLSGDKRRQVVEGGGPPGLGAGRLGATEPAGCARTDQLSCTFAALADCDLAPPQGARDQDLLIGGRHRCRVIDAA